MTVAERLRRITSLAQSVEQVGSDPEARRERRIKAIYGNLGIERTDLTLEEVRRALANNRAKRP